MPVIENIHNLHSSTHGFLCKTIKEINNWSYLRATGGNQQQNENSVFFKLQSSTHYVEKCS